MATAPPQTPHQHPHPHAHGPPEGGGLPPGPPIMANPAQTALLDSIPTNTLPFAILTVPMQLPPGAQLPPGVTPPTQSVVVCPTHKSVICEPCGVDFGGLNYMQQFLKDAPSEAVPPPPTIPPAPQRAEHIKKAKEDGNASFKSNNFPLAIRQYSQSADMALSRPPWEQAALGREETSIALCNRSAAFALAGEWTNALADAEAVVALKRPWTRGHYRLEEARQAAVDGLQYEPEDKDLNAVLKEMDQKLAEQ